MDARQAAKTGGEGGSRAAARVVKVPRRCSCKKSGCLKLYCDCFAGGGRCGDGCQCIGCKNQEHNQLEVAHAVQTIEKRAQKTPRASTAAAKSPDASATGFSLASGASSPPPPPRIAASTSTPITALSGSDTSSDAVTSDLSSLTGSSKAIGASSSPVVAITSSVGNGKRSDDMSAQREPCDCVGGCSTGCPCLELFNGCWPSCSCHGCRPQRREKTKGCSCKKSHCLKLYCECLAAQRMCDELCNCEGCKNCAESFTERERAIAAILDRNPMAFQPKVASGSSQHLRGCNCRKSGCMKNYCECFQAGVPCTSRCACHQCRNIDTFAPAKKVAMLGGISAATEDQQQLQRHSQRGRVSHKTLRRRPSIMAASSSPAASSPASPSTVSMGNRRLSALELLSESAPAAARSAYAVAFPSRTPSSRTPSSRYPPPSAAASLLSLRPEDRDQQARVRHPQPTAMGGAEGVAPSFMKRKYSKVGPSLELDGRSPASGSYGQSSGALVIPQPLPNVDTVLDGAYGIHGETTSDVHAAGLLSMLCQSLLSAAMAAEARDPSSPSTGGPSSADGDHSMLETELEDEKMADGDSDGEVVSRREASLSPGASGLLCDEDMTGDDDLSQGDGRASHWASPRGKTGQEKDKPASDSTAAAQERAVLQEFSVWLRTISASPIATPNQ